MENKTKYILTITGIIIISLIVFDVYQQRTITSLRKDVVPRTDVSVKMSSAYLAVKKNLEDNTKVIKGVVISKKGNLFTIQAEVVDFLKLSALTEDELHQKITDFPTTKKSYKVLVNDKTQFESLSLENLLEGMTVVVDTENLVYKSDQLNASKIVAVKPEDFSSSKDFIDKIKDISGEIKEINSNYLLVGVTWMDYTKIKDPFSGDPKAFPKISKNYKVLVGDKTQFMDNKLKEFKVGDFVRAFSSAPVYSVNEFTATKIEGPVKIESHLPNFPGQVINKDADKLIVREKNGSNGRVYTVRVTSTTEIDKINPSYDPSKQIEKITKINFSDIQVNDQVWIISRDEIENKTEIDAEVVSVENPS